MQLAALLILLAQVATSGVSGASGHLLAGARAFREFHFQEALVEFRVAQKLGAPEAAGYTGATLVKLGRADEALEVFATASTGDALLDYYRAVACHQARLYLCADKFFAGVEGRSGPHIAEETAKVRAAIRAALSAEPSRDTIDWYLTRCAALQKGGRPVLAAANCEEAVGLGERRKDRYGKVEADKLRGSSAKAAPAVEGR